MVRLFGAPRFTLPDIVNPFSREWTFHHFDIAILDWPLEILYRCTLGTIDLSLLLVVRWPCQT
jgi:hypothetical protein